MLKKLKPIIIALIIIILVILSYLRETGEVTQTSFALNTTIYITAKGKNAKTITQQAIQRVNEIEKHITAYSQTSDLSKGVLSDDAKKVVERGLYFGKKSDGYFDITIKPLVDLWGVTTPTPKVPSNDEIEKALSLVDYTKTSINGDKLIISEGMSIDLGGIGKGYAADEAAKVLRENGITDGIVDLGGDIVVLGKKRIGIQNPLSGQTGDYMAVIEIKDSSIVTSGSYERNFKEGGKTYHHILNPKTGRPSESGLLSATVISENSQDADAIATIIYILGADEGLSFANEMGVQAMVIDEEKTVHKTKGVNIKITDTDFKEKANDN